MPPIPCLVGAIASPWEHPFLLMGLMDHLQLGFTTLQTCFCGIIANAVKRAEQIICCLNLNPLNFSNVIIRYGVVFLLCNDVPCNSCFLDVLNYCLRWTGRHPSHCIADWNAQNILYVCQWSHAMHMNRVHVSALPATRQTNPL